MGKINRFHLKTFFFILQSFGVSITDRDGWKLTFSGDTRPCEELVKLGMNSDLLIHEATMEDGWEDEANAKRHSTTSQAIQVCGAKPIRFCLACV